MDKVLYFYNLFKSEKKKERFDIILEPLQAVTQLALLSFCPKGSKLTISNNLLSIQSPNWGQGFLRLYNNDGRDDLFFLFNAIVRFNRFYMYIRDESEEFCDLFDLLVKLGKSGIDKLLQTYANTDQPALLHTLQMYRTLLDKPSLFKETEKNELNKETKNIDDIFINIRLLYSNHELIVLYQTLLLLEQNNDKYETYILGLNTILTPVFEKIQKWIIDKIVF